MSPFARIALLPLAVTIAACSGRPAPGSAGLPATSAETAGAASEHPTAPPASSEQSSPPLDGTSWRLVKIMSMDDTTYTPQDSSRYTLTFGADGTVAVKADCNEGAGTWVSPSTAQLEFNELALTDAACTSDSLHGQYEKQLPWVRSYVTKGGHLFLATMADGAIIEFEPAGP